MILAKYDAMLRKNQKKCKDKENLAFAAIREMEDHEEPIQICELVRRTGLSRGFFYRNETVREELERVLEKQSGKVLANPKQVIFDKALEHKVAALERQVAWFTKENEKLKAENERLKKAMRGRNLEILKGL